MNTRLKDFISGVVFLVVMVLCGCEYQHDNKTEEVTETILETYGASYLGLPPGTLHGTIDLTPTSPEGKPIPGAAPQHGTVDIKIPAQKPTSSKPSVVMQKTTKTTTPVIIEPSYNE